MKVVRGGTVVTEQGVARLDVGIEDGLVAALAPNLEGEEVVDARGLHVFPGFFDAHVHFCDEGQAEWEDFATAGRAAVAGGTTTVMDMPLNDPMTVTPEAFANRLKVVGSKAITVLRALGGCVPGNVGAMKGMRDLGARAFKAFMIRTRATSTVTRRPPRGDARGGQAGCRFGVHAESDDMVRVRKRRRMIAESRADAEAHAWAHDEFSEYERSADSITLAREAGCRLHVLHVNARAALPEVAAADRVVGEAQIGFLTMDDDDYVQHGPWARFSPPLRTRETVEALWDGLADGTLEYVISDHSGYPPEMKDVESIWDATDGIPTAQPATPFLLSEGVRRRGLSLERFASLVVQAARLYGLYPRKGAPRAGRVRRRPGDRGPRAHLDDRGRAPLLQAPVDAPVRDRGDGRSCGDRASWGNRLLRRSREGGSRNGGAGVSVVDFCAELLRIESTPGNERRAVERAAQEMADHGYDEVRIDEHGNLIGRIGPEDGRPVLVLDAHIDTIPLHAEAWTHDPLGAQIVDGAMYGLGASDMKGRSPRSSTAARASSGPMRHSAGRSTSLRQSPRK